MASEKCLAKISEGVEAWNQWRMDNWDLLPDPSEMDLSGTDIKKVDLRKAILTRADLKGFDLSGTNLEEANLSMADLSESDLSGANLSGADLSKANLNQANLSEADLSEAILNEANLSKADLEGANVSPAGLGGANLTEANLSEANLNETCLSGANLSKANLIKAKLSEAHFVESNLEGANLIGVDLRGANLSEAKLSEANLSGAELERACLSEANLSGANLKGAKLGKADLSGANLSGTFLKGADLSGADLSGADLRKAYLNGAHLKGTYLSGADLSEANLKLANLINANLNKATLTGARLYEIQSDGWTIEGVQCSHIYSDSSGKTRVPKDYDFEEGEFECRFASLPSFEYIFENGMHPLDPFFMNQVIEEIKNQNPEYELEVDSIQVKGAKPSVKFTVKNEYLDKAEAQVKSKYEKENKRLKDHIDNLTQVLINVSENPGSITMNDNRQITAGNVNNANLGDNFGTQTWNQVQSKIEDSQQLEDSDKKWLKLITENLKNENLPDQEQSFAQTKVDEIKNELEKEKPNKNIIKRAWKFLETAAPTLEKIANTSSKIASFLDKTGAPPS